ncbi:MAG: hypothetical protein KF893_22195 [Caldilineaceae bacterium]|nr:hypothetical protein [Caldilineaceae bacterium]
MGQETTLSISHKTQVQLKKLAEVRGETVEALAETAIREYLRQDTRQRLSQEIEAYRSMHPDLLRQYLDEHVAVHQGKVVDHDLDQSALYLRVRKRYPHEVVWIRQVRPEVERTFTIRSPRFERD